MSVYWTIGPTLLLLVAQTHVIDSFFCVFLKASAVDFIDSASLSAILTTIMSCCYEIY